MAESSNLPADNLTTTGPPTQAISSGNVAEDGGNAQTAAKSAREPRMRRRRNKWVDSNGNVVSSPSGETGPGDEKQKSKRGEKLGKKVHAERTSSGVDTSSDKLHTPAHGEGDTSGRSDRSSPSISAPSTGRPPKRRGNNKPISGAGEPSRQAEHETPSGSGPARASGRRRQINSRLTESTDAALAPASRPSNRKTDLTEPKIDNLTSRLIHSLRTHPFPDCPICFNSIHPGHPIWSCSPSSPKSTLQERDSENDSSQCCYTPFHLKCIKSWASKSVKDTSEAYRTRGEVRQGEWRCPGCQRRRTVVPQSYMCFCNAVTDPRPPRIATPHSCGNPCSRPRACGHGCPLSCHPGPCPPCHVTTQMPCYCSRETKSFRCADLTATNSNAGISATGPDLSCGRRCEKSLGCGQHSCPTVCHPGECLECPIVESGRCYCGKTEKELKCGEGKEELCSVIVDGKKEGWTGRFMCDKTCDRAFDCGIHQCEKPCHPPSAVPPPCPRSPSLITHCPCGKKKLEDMVGRGREKCTDPIPTCGSVCMKELDGCEHVCSIPCHTGGCPPCAIPVILPCRCGTTTRAVPCHELPSTQNQLEILCDRPCTALRSCGRHQCNRICCPLASLSSGTKAKGKKKAPVDESVVDEAGWHACDLVCGKMLGCGNHRCEERDHRGICPPCLRSSFEEMICHCGRTVIEPPVPCGTRMSCTYPCALPPPPCGHPKTPHTCHEDLTPCPPCPFLTPKTCTCGKNVVKNVRCSQEKVSCGTTCGKLLGCGFHHCERLCHGEDCGPCTSVCGKPRKLCLPAHHQCTLPCHAPASCSEIEPCQATITLKCPCGRIQQPSSCGRSISNVTGREVTQQLKCSNECLIAKRNAKLAEALGISSDVNVREGAKLVTYTDELVAFARANSKFCTMVEKSFADFVTLDKKSQVLPYMPEARRSFVQSLASIYRLDTKLVDQEPQRSVQIIRRIDTRIPKPLLSAAAGSPGNLGKLADMRGPSPVRAPNSAVVSSSAGPPTATAKRGWTSVVAAVPQTQTGWRSQTPPSTSQSTAGPVSSASTQSSLAWRPAAIRAASPSASSPQSIQENEPVPDDWENDI